MLEYYGMGVPQRVNEAVQAWRRAATLGHTQAATNLAVLYMTGTGLPQDDQQAYSWLSAAMSHSPTAHTKWLLGRMLYDGRVAGLSEDAALGQAAKVRAW